MCVLVFVCNCILSTYLYIDEAFSRESKSLRQVCQLVIKICESLALWKLLSENQLQVTIACLKEVTMPVCSLFEHIHIHNKRQIIIISTTLLLAMLILMIKLYDQY